MVSYLICVFGKVTFCNILVFDMVEIPSIRTFFEALTRATLTLYGVDFDEDWKLLTILIGMNDICDYCKDKVWYHAGDSMTFSV